MAKKKPRIERMEEIISAAIDEFLEKGYENASMASISARAGVSKGGVYHHFKSKDEILMVANQQLCEPIFELMAHVNSLNSIDEGLTFYIHNYLEYWYHRPREVSFFFLTMTKVLSAPEQWHLYEEYFETMIGFFEDLFRRGVENGEFISHNTRASALALLPALDGILGYMVMDRKLQLDEIVPCFIDRFITVLKTQTTP